MSVCDEKVRVAFVVTKLDFGGAEQQWFSLIKGIDKNRFEISVFCFFNLGSIGSKIKALGVDVYHRLLINKFSIIKYFKFVCLLKRKKIQVFFIMKSPLAMLFGVLAAKLVRARKIILAIHSTYPSSHVRRNFIISKLMVPVVDEVVALSRMHSEYLVQQEHIAKEKIVTIYNGIKISDFLVSRKNANLKLELGIPEKNKVVGIVARLHRCKRHDIFIHAAKKVLNSCNDVTFLIIGDGPERESLIHLISELQVQNQVLMLGFRSDISDLMSILNVSVLVSDVEAFPMTLLESMAASIPIVATDVGSISEIVHDGKNGLLVPAGDVDSVAKAIFQLITHSELAETMGNIGFNIVESTFSGVVMIKEYEKLFMKGVENV